MPQTPRKYLPPKVTGIGSRLTLDDMELYSQTDTELGRWCQRMLAIEVERTLDSLGATHLLPRGIVDRSVGEEDGTLVTGLLSSGGEVFAGGVWTTPDTPVDVSTTVDLDDASVAFVARAQLEGADAVLFRSPLPVAFIGAGEGADPAEETGLPAGAVAVAIVDSYDRSSVLELLAVLPGPKVLRRHDGAWEPDDAWATVMRSVKPPAMAQLLDEMLPGVIEQVDNATAGQPYTPFDAKNRSQYVTASAYVQELKEETESVIFATNLAAAAGKQLTPADVKNTERLRRYWLYGKGAAKIRWGTPGAWTRCYKNVVKHMGPKAAPGYCTNLSQRLGGPGVATHVGD